MPRTATNKVGAIVAFFKTATREVAEVALDLARDAIKERKALADKVRTGQQKAAKKAAAAAEAPKPKKSHKAKAKAAPVPKPVAKKRKPRTRKPKDQALPLEPASDLASDIDPIDPDLT